VAARRRRSSNGSKHHPYTKPITLIDVAEAARLGLVNRVVDADRLMPWALETAELIGISVFDHDVAPLGPSS
jgi:hypothetical protein